MCLKIFELEKVANDYLIIRYEDLIDNLEIEITKCLDYLELPKSELKLDELKNLPVFGSSIQKDSFKTVEKKKDFKALEKWRGLTKRSVEFNTC